MHIKKFSLPVLIAILISVSCQKPTDLDSQEYRFDLSEEGIVSSLKANGLSWRAGSQVGLFLENGKTISAEVKDNDGVITIVAQDEGLAGGTAVYPFYPYVSDSSRDGIINVNLAPEQRGGAAAMPMVGEPFTVQTGKKVKSNGTIHFKGLGAMVDIRIYSSGSSAGEKIESVYFRTVSGGPLTGKAKVKLTDATPEGNNTPELRWEENGKQYYALLETASVVATSIGDADAPHYLLIAPGTYSGNITVITEAAVYSVPVTDMEFSSGSVKYQYIDLNSKKVTRREPFNIENDQVKGFLDAVEKTPYKVSDYSYTYVTGYANGTGSSKRLDLPKPVTVRWTNPESGSGDKVITVYTDPAMTEEEISVTANSSVTSANVYNLIPKRTWYYKITNDGKDMETGIFKTTGRRRMIKVGESTYGKNYANNCRDFGGQITESGKTIKYGKIFRGSNMDDTSEEAKKVLLKYMKIGLDVDLRSQGTGDRGKYQLDALGFGNRHTTETYGSWANLSDATRMKGTLTKIFSAVENNTAVYIHCKVGADRTGYVCMLLEALLGIPQERCDVDYEMTSFSGAVGSRTRTGVNNYYYVSITEDGVTTIQGVDFINTFAGSTFQEKAINYVTNTIGIPLATITAFQNHMLE